MDQLVQNHLVDQKVTHREYEAKLADKVKAIENNVSMLGEEKARESKGAKAPAETPVLQVTPTIASSPASQECTLGTSNRVSTLRRQAPGSLIITAMFISASITGLHMIPILITSPVDFTSTGEHISLFWKIDNTNEVEEHLKRALLNIFLLHIQCNRF